MTNTNKKIFIFPLELSENFLFTERKTSSCYTFFDVLESFFPFVGKDGFEVNDTTGRILEWNIWKDEVVKYIWAVDQRKFSDR